MGLKADLESEVAEIFRGRWSERDGNGVPSDTSVQLGNDAVKIEGTVLYADMADSTKLVDGFKPYFAAEIYKTFLRSAAKIITSESGTISAYDGDRVMGVYHGTTKNSSAVRTALKIRFAVREIITPAIKKQYPDVGYIPKCVVGIDTSPLFVAKTGIRGSNDLVWVGRAANHAAKLTSLPDSYSTYITDDVYKVISEDVKVSSDGRQMWESARWNTFDDRLIYRSNWQWRVP